MPAQAARIPYQACPLCEAADPVEVLVADCSGHHLYKPALPATQRWMQCWSCGHLFVDGYFTPAALQVLLSATQADQAPGGREVEMRRTVWAPVLDAVAAHRPALGGRWLDVGFGDGSLLTTAEEYGYEVVGVDARADSARLMREAGYEAHALEFDAFRPAEPFDVVSMADALEHMPFPGRSLRHAHALLRPEGLLFLSMPNADAYVWRVMNEQGLNPYWAEIEHYHNFGRRRLYALLEECGFRPVRYGVSARYVACMEIVARRTAG